MIYNYSNAKETAFSVYVIHTNRNSLAPKCPGLASFICKLLHFLTHLL